MKRKKKILISVGAVVLCVGIVFSVYLSRHRLSLMSEDKRKQFLVESGVSPELANTGYDEEFLKELENDPESWGPVNLGDFEPMEAFEQLRVVVNMYYHRPRLPKNTVLSEMADDECKQFLTDVGVEIRSSAYTMSTVKDILAKYENDRNYTYDRNPGIYSAEDKLHNQLRVVVFMYYQ